jgi:hypothetical protein
MRLNPSVAPQDVKRLSRQAKRMAAMVGSRFGRWLVLSVADANRLACKCDCGKEKPVWACHLRSGASKSCGCIAIEANRTHGESGGGAGSRRGTHSAEYLTWQNMRARCNRPSLPGYKHYGGRGISVCARWNDFGAFLSDIGRRPSAKHSLDRINNEGNYEPGNCRWVTGERQMRNTRLTTILTIGETSLPLADWAEGIGLSRGGLRKRLALGWDPLEAVTRPVNGVPVEIVVLS